MTFRTLVRATSLSLGLVILALPAAAGPIVAIPGLFNTGVDANGNVLPTNTLGDPHYALAAVPGGSSSTIRVLSSASGFPIPPYLADNTSSRWIMPNNGGSGDWTSPDGTYVFRTTFNLTGMLVPTASITGGWTSDNDGIKIALNGVQVAGATSYTQFSAGFAPFVIPAGSGAFQAGINTLDFYVNNGVQATGNPTALRVQMTGTVEQDTSYVPVPDGGSTLILLGAALSLVGLLRRAS